MDIRNYLFIRYPFLFVLSIVSFTTASGQNTFKSEIIESVSHFQVRDHKLIRTDSVMLQVNQRLGDGDANFGFPYSKGDKVEVLYAQLEDTTGTIIRKLKKNEIKDQSYISDISLYEDDFIKLFEMKHSTYPYRVSYAVRTTYQKFLQIYSLDLIYQRKPVRDATVIVETPGDRLIKYKQRNIDNPTVETFKNQTYHIWKYSYTPIKGWDVNTDYNQTDAPQLMILPLAFEYGKRGSWESWESFGDWIYRLNSGRDILSQSEIAKINALLTGITSDREKVKAIYRYLQQNIRYINVKINVGGFQTYPAQYVADHRYGDCKALTNYMLSALKQIGITSYYTLVYADEEIVDIDPGFASQEFNHVILTVPLAGDTLFLECTGKSLPFGYIHSEIQGRTALLVKERDSRLISIPAMQAEEVRCTRNFTIQGNQLKLESTQRGEPFELFASLLINANRNTQDRYVRQTILPSGNYRLSDYKIDRADNDSALVRITASLQIENIAKRYGNNMIFTSFPIQLPNYETPDKRTFGLQLSYPVYQTDTIVYQDIIGEIAKCPDPVDIDTPFGSYHQHFEAGDGSLTVRKTLLIRSGRYTPDEYEAFYNFITKVKRSEEKNIYIEIL